LKRLNVLELINQQKINKVNIIRWEALYNQRFQKYIKEKNNKLDKLDKMWNKPNQAYPVVNAKYNTNRQSNKQLDFRVEDRLINAIDQHKLNIKKIERDLTPSFRPKINKNTYKLASHRSRNLIRGYNSLNVMAAFGTKYTNNTLSKFAKEFNTNMYTTESKIFDSQNKYQSGKQFLMYK